MKLAFRLYDDSKIYLTHFVLKFLFLLMCFINSLNLIMETPKAEQWYIKGQFKEWTWQGTKKKLKRGIWKYDKHICMCKYRQDSQSGWKYVRVLLALQKGLCHMYLSLVYTPVSYLCFYTCVFWYLRPEIFHHFALSTLSLILWFSLITCTTEMKCIMPEER